MPLDELIRRVNRLHKQLDEENTVRQEHQQKLDAAARRGRR